MVDLWLYSWLYSWLYRGYTAGYKAGYTASVCTDWLYSWLYSWLLFNFAFRVGATSIITPTSGYPTLNGGDKLATRATGSIGLYVTTGPQASKVRILDN